MINEYVCQGGFQIVTSPVFMAPVFMDSFLLKKKKKIVTMDLYCYIIPEPKEPAKHCAEGISFMLEYIKGEISK